MILCYARDDVWHLGTIDEAKIKELADDLLKQFTKFSGWTQEHN